MVITRRLLLGAILLCVGLGAPSQERFITASTANRRRVPSSVTWRFTAAGPSASAHTEPSCQRPATSPAAKM